MASLESESPSFSSSSVFSNPQQPKWPCSQTAPLWSGPCHKTTVTWLIDPAMRMAVVFCINMKPGRQPGGLEAFQTALCFSSLEGKSIHNWWQFKERLYCGISNKTSEKEGERIRGMREKGMERECVGDRDGKCALHPVLLFSPGNELDWLK